MKYIQITLTQQVHIAVAAEKIRIVNKKWIDVPKWVSNDEHWLLPAVFPQNCREKKNRLSLKACLSLLSKRTQNMQCYT